MTRFLIVLLSFGLLATHEVTGQSSSPSSIQGVWQVVEVTITGPSARTIPIPEPRPNLTIITATHYSRVQVEADARPMLRDVTTASADELRAAWGPFYGEAGTYTVEGNVITMHPIAAKNPATMAPKAFTTWSYKLEGNTLSVTALRNQDGPVTNPVTVKAVRVE
jgi:hypothetical protein